MFPEINDILAIDSNLSGLSILALEKGSDASFLLHHFMSMYLKENQKVCLVLFGQSFSHYNSVGNKLSVSLMKAKEKGNLKVIDGLRDVGGSLNNAACENKFLSDLIDFKGEKHSTLKPLFVKIKSTVDEMSKENNTLIVIDDLSVLLNIGVPCSDIYFFMKYLQSLEKEGLYISLHLGKYDEEAEVLSKQLSHISDITIETQGLSSGYCKDVHGEMVVDRVNNKYVSPLQTKRMQFRVKDKSVEFFAVGTSGAVL